MWSPLRKIILVSGFCFIAYGCGFQPMYGDHSVFSQNTPLSGNLIIDPIRGHEGQIFVAALEDRLNPEGLKSASPEYKLAVSLTKTMTPTVVNSEGTIQRYDVKFTSKCTLTHIADGKVLISSTMSRIGSYNVTINANFSTYEAEQDTIQRTLEELAEEYAIRLAGYFADKK
jgi:hypothetical protein